MYAPPFILSPEPPLSGSGPILGTQIHPILFDPDEAVLFCGYCVSSDQRWMLVVCCDRQGELLDTSVIGIPHSASYEYVVVRYAIILYDVHLDKSGKVLLNDTKKKLHTK